MVTKYKKIIPLEDQDDILYELPSPEVIAAVKSEKSKRKVLSEGINADKKNVINEMEGKRYVRTQVVTKIIHKKD